MSDLLQIHVPRTSYKAGDVVSGSVYLFRRESQDKVIDIESISIIFSGRLSPTKYWPRIPKSLQLFAYKKTLLAGPSTLHIPSVGCEDQYSWPFTFTFPVNCNGVQNDTSSVHVSSDFNADHDQPLPPSLSTTSGEADSRGCASIIYDLQATLLSLSKTGYHAATCIKRLELNLYVPRNTEQPGLECVNKTQRIICQTLDLLPKGQRESAKRPLGLREKLGLKSVPTDHLPKAEFDAKLQTPSSAIIGQPLPIFLYVDYDLDKSTIEAPPAVYLKRVAVWFREVTSMLVPKPSSLPMQQEQAGWTNGVQIAAQNFDKDLPLVNGCLDMRKVVNLTLKDDLVPTMKTFNIARSYGLKVTMTLECAGKSFFIYGNYNPCTLLAKQFDPNVPEYVEPRAPAVTVDATDDPPPRYEAVEQRSTPSQSSHASQRTRRRRRRHHGAAFAGGGAFMSAGAFSGGGGGGGGGGC